MAKPSWFRVVALLFLGAMAGVGCSSSQTAGGATTNDASVSGAGGAGGSSITVLPDGAVVSIGPDGAVISTGASPIKVSHLVCEYLTNPIAVDVLQPRLSWALESTERGQKQTA